MRIVAVRLHRVGGHLDPDWHWAVEKDTVHPLHLYAEFRAAPAPPPQRPIPFAALYVELRTEQGLTGRYGPIYEEQAFLIARKLRPFLTGRDPTPVEELWDQMYRLDRHMQTGLGMMAISAVDNALWDLRGQAAGKPVFRLLSEQPRTSLPAYRSTNDYPNDGQDIAAFAKAIQREGYAGYKWFFRHGPGSGARGLAENRRLVATSREALGPDAVLMFDCFMSWDAEYAAQMAPAVMEAKAMWLEEVFPPRFLDAFRALHREFPRLPLATGEHLFTRWEVKPFLDEGLLAVVQCDPDWCGGITELRRICELAASFGVPVIPHGHSVAAAIQVVAAQPERVCPLVEFLPRHLYRMQHFHRFPVVPTAGHVSPPEQPGLGLELDESRIEAREELFA